MRTRSNYATHSQQSVFIALHLKIIPLLREGGWRYGSISIDKSIK